MPLRTLLVILLPLVFTVQSQAAELPATAQKPVPAAATTAPNKKRGIGISQKMENWQQRVAALRVAWHYSWSASLQTDEAANVSFVPMIWNGSKKSLDQLDSLSSLKSAGKIDTLLGFNEPDGKEQANMSVERAIELWPSLMKTGLRLGSPAGVHATGDWMKAFMAEIEKRQYRVDFITIHVYKGPNAASFLRELAEIHALYHRPIWITEWAVADWSAATADRNRFTPEQVLAYMTAVLPALDKLDYIERYAWFPFAKTSLPGSPSALFEDNGDLTPLGKYYSNH